MLSQEQLLEYIRKAKNGDESAKSIIYEENTSLIKSIIRKFKNKGVEYDDLYQIACIGFLKAIDNFDFSFDVKFSTYTVPMIIGEIKRYMRDNGAIKVSRSLKILANKINKYIYDYQAEFDSSPSIELIAQKFDVTADDVVIALDSAKMPLSIYDKYDGEEDGQELIDKIPNEQTDEDLLTKIHISNILDTLNERDKKIIVLRYFRDRTQSEVAKDLGVSQVQISRLETKIIEKIRLKY